MNQAEKLKSSRDVLLKLHKSLVDFERAEYEKFLGTLSSGQFLNLLLNDERFAWLRKFSTLIVEIDEMFDLDEGFTDEMVEIHLRKMRDLIGMSDEDEFFRSKYRFALQNDLDSAGGHAELKNLLK